MCLHLYSFWFSVIPLHVIRLHWIISSHLTSLQISLSVPLPSLNTGIHWRLELLSESPDWRKWDVLFVFARSILTHHDGGIFSSGFLFGFPPLFIIFCETGRNNQCQISPRSWLVAETQRMLGVRPGVLQLDEGLLVLVLCCVWHSCLYQLHAR